MTKGTQKAYQRSWNVWLEFRKGDDPYLLGNGLAYNRKVVSDFLEFLIDVKKATSGTTEGIWSAIATEFSLNPQCNVSLWSDAGCRYYKKCALKIAGRSNPTNVQMKALPVCQAMLDYSRHRDWVLGDLDSRMVDLAYRWGHHFGNRPGEISIGGDTDHQILSNQVTFHFVNGSHLEAWEMRESRIVTGEVSAIVGSWLTSKTGSKELFLNRSRPEQIILLEDCIQWCFISGIRQGDPFFSRYLAGKRKCLERSQLSVHVAAMAVAFDLDAKGFTNRSLRVGAATNLAAGGASKSDIDRAVGWSTQANTSLIYTRSVPGVVTHQKLHIADLKIMQTNANFYKRSPRSSNSSTLPREEVHAIIPVLPQRSVIDCETPRWQKPGNRFSNMSCYTNTVVSFQSGKGNPSC